MLIPSKDSLHFIKNLVNRFSTLIASVILILLNANSTIGKESSPDIIMIIVDDLNDSISLLSPSSPLKTPNIKKLAERGLLFTKAYCQSPACNPSRAAVMTGLNPSTTGIYGNKSNWRKATKSHPTFFETFGKSGYQVSGAGKIYHHHFNGAFHHTASFDEFQHMAKQNMPPKKLNGAPEYGSRNTDWGQWPLNEKETIDYKSVDFCIEKLATRIPSKPLFVACGIFKPHSPFFAPPEYHTNFDEKLEIHAIENDWDDLPGGAHKLIQPKKWFYKGMMDLEKKRPGSYRNFIDAYAACIRFADAQIGRLLAAIDEYSKKDNTIIILWSDHGFHLGEKRHIEKFALWEKSTHVPFIVVAPGITQPGIQCNVPVDLSSIYPTICDLAGISDFPQNLDGKSLLPLLKNPEFNWTHAALSTYGRGNHAVRIKNWRLIKYRDGSMELYNVSQDPNEWYNLAPDPTYKKTISWLMSYFPKSEKAPVVDLKPKK